MGVVSEESGVHRPGSALVAVIDPVDGSTNASRGIPWYASSICVLDADGPRVSVVANLATGSALPRRAGRRGVARDDPGGAVGVRAPAPGRGGDHGHAEGATWAGPSSGPSGRRRSSCVRWPTAPSTPSSWGPTPRWPRGTTWAPCSCARRPAPSWASSTAASSSPRTPSARLAVVAAATPALLDRARDGRRGRGGPPAAPRPAVMASRRRVRRRRRPRPVRLPHWRADGQPKTRFRSEHEANRAAFALPPRPRRRPGRLRVRVLRRLAPGQHAPRTDPARLRRRRRCPRHQGPHPMGDRQRLGREVPFEKRGRARRRRRPRRRAAARPPRRRWPGCGRATPRGCRRRPRRRRTSRAP